MKPLSTARSAMLLAPLLLLLAVLAGQYHCAENEKPSESPLEKELKEIFGDDKDVADAVLDYMSKVPSSHRSRSHANRFLGPLKQNNWKYNWSAKAGGVKLHPSRSSKGYDNQMKDVMGVILDNQNKVEELKCEKECTPCKEVPDKCIPCEELRSNVCPTCPPCPPIDCPIGIPDCPPPPGLCPICPPATTPKPRPTKPSSIKPSSKAPKTTTVRSKSTTTKKPSPLATLHPDAEAIFTPPPVSTTTTTTTKRARTTTKLPNTTTGRPKTSTDRPKTTSTRKPPSTTTSRSSSTSTKRPNSSTTTTTKRSGSTSTTKQPSSSTTSTAPSNGTLPSLGSNMMMFNTEAKVTTTTVIGTNGSMITSTSTSYKSNGIILFDRYLPVLVKDPTLRDHLLKMINAIPDSTGGDEMSSAHKVLTHLGEKQPKPRKGRGNMRSIAVKGARSNFKEITGHVMERYVRKKCSCPLCKLPKTCSDCSKKSTTKKANCPAKRDCPSCPPQSKKVCAAPRIGCLHPPCPACSELSAEEKYDQLDKDLGKDEEYDDADPVDPVDSAELKKKVPCEGFTCNFAKTCGKADLNPLTPKGSQTGYMNGGEAQKYGEYPHFVRIELRVEQDSPPGICGGVLITDQHVLTAGHCVHKPVEIAKNGSIIYERLKPNNMTIVAGEHLRYKKDKYEESRNVTNICLASKFNDPHGEGSRYDYAILTLDKKITFNDYIQPACLPYEPIALRPPNKCFVVGIGLNKWDKTGKHVFSTVVQKMPVERTSCKDWGIRAGDRSRHCFTKSRAKGDTCAGDSGGPVLCVGKSNRWTVMGLVSYGSQACDGTESVGWVAVYTRIQALMKNIKADCKI